jgi:hypothetical protein
MQIFWEPTLDNAEQMMLSWQDFMLDPENLEDPLFNRLTVEPWMALGLSKYDSRSDFSEKKLFLTVMFYGDEQMVNDWLEARILPKLASWRHLNQLSRSQSSTII